MEDYLYLLKLGLLVPLIMSVVGAPWLGWRVGDIILMFWRECRRRPLPGYPYNYGIPPGWVLYLHLDEYMSTDEVARRCGCSASLIYDLIGGKARLEEEMAHQLACLVDVPASTCSAWRPYTDAVWREKRKRRQWQPSPRGYP